MQEFESLSNHYFYCHVYSTLFFFRGLSEDAFYNNEPTLNIKMTYLGRLNQVSKQHKKVFRESSWNEEQLSKYVSIIDISYGTDKIHKGH